MCVDVTRDTAALLRTSDVVTFNSPPFLQAHTHAYANWRNGKLQMCSLDTRECLRVYGAVFQIEYSADLLLAM